MSATRLAVGHGADSDRRDFQTGGSEFDVVHGCSLCGPDWAIVERLVDGLGYMSRRCTSNAKHSSATSLGRERDRPVCFSIRRNRWRTVLGWQNSRSVAAFTDASLSCHTRNVSKSISRSSSGRSAKQSNAAPTVWTITCGALTAAVARMEPSNTATED